MPVLLNVAYAQDRTDSELTRWIQKRPNIVRIVIEGNAALDDGDIRRVMELTTPGFWAKLGLRSRPRLIAATMRRDEESIRREYRRRGFWGATVDVTAEPDSAGKGAIVHAGISEGPRSYWGDVTFDGDHPVLGSRVGRHTSQLRPGAPADSLKLAFVRMLMLSECADRAHPGAQVSYTVVPRGDTLDVRFTLASGPKVILGDLTIDGLRHTREYVVRRELNLSRGDEYSRARFDERQQDVYATGLFTFVRLETAYSDTQIATDTRTADMRLRIVERPPSFIGFRTGAGQDPDRDLTWDYAVEWGSRNWRGTGRKWTLTAQSGFVVVTEWRVLHHRFSARYVEPWVFGLRLPAALEIAYEPGVRAPNQNYRVEQSSAELNVSRRFRRYYRLWSSLVYERVVIYGVPEKSPEEVLAERGIKVRRRWSLALERDTRPNIFVPTSGARTRFDVEYAGGVLGGANDFYKVDFSWARYQMINAPSVFATRIRVGWAGPHSGARFVPTLDRFYLGGANSIRGYSESTVGPVDSLGAPIGGEVIGLINLELRTPVTRKLWFTLFGDAGNNWSRFRDVKPEDVLLSIGVGWQYLAPVGPIRLDYARRVVHPGHPKSDRLHLSILFSF